MVGVYNSYIAFLFGYMYIRWNNYAHARDYNREKRKKSKKTKTKVFNCFCRVLEHTRPSNHERETREKMHARYEEVYINQLYTLLFYQ